MEEKVRTKFFVLVKKNNEYFAIGPYFTFPAAEKRLSKSPEGSVLWGPTMVGTGEEAIKEYRESLIM